MDWLVQRDDGAVRKARVMVVDDDEFTAKLLRDTLATLGIHNAVLAEDGVDAIRKLRFARGDFDLLICDLSMPKMDGMSFIGYVRAGKAGCDPEMPILVVTVSAGAGVVKEAISHGISGYIVKPISLGELEEKLKAALPITEQS